MKIIGDLRNLEGASGSFFHREVKQVSVVRLELDDAALSQDAVIAPEIFGRGKAASGVPLLGPGIGKIEIDPADFSLGKISVDQFGVPADKEQVLQLQLLLFFQASQKDTGIFFNADVIDLGMLLRQLHDEAALSGSDFQVKRPVISENFFPVSAVVFRFLYNPGAGGNGVARARNVSESHIFICPFLIFS